MPFVGGMFGFGGGSTPEHVVTSGALAAQAALLDGAATRYALHTGIGALAAQYATVSGSALHPHVASGALAAGAAAVSGTAVFTDQDPCWPEVTLLVPGNSSTQFDDISSYLHSSTQTGSISVAASSESFTGYAIKTPTGSSDDYSEYVFEDGFCSSDESHTVEFFAQIVEQNGIGNGYAFPRGIFIQFGNTSADSDHRYWHGGMISGADLFTLGNPASTQEEWTSAGLSSGYDRHHVAFVRDMDTGTASIFVNGRYFMNGSYSSTVLVNRVRIGKYLGTRWTSALIEQVRITKGCARYARPDPAIVGTVCFTPPTAPFPTS